MRNGEYVYEVLKGGLLDPDEYLAKYDDWRDISTWPVSSRESEVVKAAVNKVADPLGKEGIVVKDLSRFGRDYIETGNYLEKIFPFLGVRFISITDHFDSFTFCERASCGGRQF